MDHVDELSLDLKISMSVFSIICRSSTLKIGRPLTSISWSQNTGEDDFCKGFFENGLIIYINHHLNKI